MSELNERQKRLVEKTDGFIVVDAGPGTGKTHTVVSRYSALISKNIDPMDILMITFTRNAAQEMKERISSELNELSSSASDPDIKARYQNASRNVKTSTFDALCLDIVKDSPEGVSDFFGFKDCMLSRNATIVENETLNKEYFASYYARFIKEKGKRYAKRGLDPAAVVGERVNDVYSLLTQLMSRGVIPLELEWFGDGEKVIRGDVEAVRSRCVSADMGKVYAKLLSDEILSSMPKEKDQAELPDMIADEDRFMLFEFIRDVYYGFIRESVTDNRLTFGLAELFAFAVLWEKRGTKNVHSVKYMIVDEFQDTNELQMKICLLLLSEPNLCAVGDWKQGIYGFRFVTIENITEFRKRITGFARELFGSDLPYKLEDFEKIDFEENYRSSQVILDKSFEALDIKGSDNEVIVHAPAVPLKPMKDAFYGDRTHVETILSETKDGEIESVVDRIIEYRNSGRFAIVEENNGARTERQPDFGDMAVLCRTGNYCRMVLECCERRGVPAFFQGDLEIMNTREGKIALAWLRYVNNENDRRGLASILAYAGYPLSELTRILDGSSCAPSDIKELRLKLIGKRRRPNDLLTTVFGHYGIDNDISQTIVNVLSSAYSDSLMTLSDLIRLIEEDIRNGTTYPVEPALEMKAVTIQTMHKSKGLEYPIVIIAGLDDKVMPKGDKGGPYLRFDDEWGIRCTKEYVSVGEGTSKREAIVDSWRYKLLKSAYPTDYSEERRLLFVAMTRAKQYLTMTAYSNKGKKSRFFAHYESVNTVPETFDLTEEFSTVSSDRPDIGGYERRRRSLSAHDLMDTLPMNEGIRGKGAEYGDRVHEAANLMVLGHGYDTSLPETGAIAEILSGLKGAALRPELPCVLPIGDVSVKGTIDLLAEFDDRIEIHDWKTDADESGLERYTMQLSVYAHAAEVLGKKIRCFIDFVSLGISEEVTPMPMERLEIAVEDYYRRIDNLT